MGTKYKQPGITRTFTAPSGGVTVDVPVLIGGLLVIPQVTAAQTVSFTGMVAGIFTGIAKKTGEAWTENQKLYWDNGNSRLTTTSTDGVLVGVAAAVAASAATTGDVALSGVPSDVSEGPQAAIADLGQDISATYVEAEVQAISDKVDAILAALRAFGAIASS